MSPKVTISKIKFRRGTDNQRKQLVFDQGEPVFTIDTKRLFVGNGVYQGGVVVGSKIHPPTSYHQLSNIPAEVGDMVYADNIAYQLTATNPTVVSSWADVGSKVDGITIKYNTNNKLGLTLIAPISSTAWTTPQTDGYGRVLSAIPTITDVVYGKSSLGGANITNSLSSIFDGSPTSTSLSGVVPTLFTGLSSDGTTILTLSSAGFITFDSTYNTKSGKVVNRFAIPIFKY